jgi:hypothetical protein
MLFDYFEHIKKQKKSKKVILMHFQEKNTFKNQITP